MEGELREHIPRQDLKALLNILQERGNISISSVRRMDVPHCHAFNVASSASFCHSWDESPRPNIACRDEMHNVGSDRFRADENEETVNLDNRESDFLRFDIDWG